MNITNELKFLINCQKFMEKMIELTGPEPEMLNKLRENHKAVVTLVSMRAGRQSSRSNETTPERQPDDLVCDE